MNQGGSVQCSPQVPKRIFVAGLAMFTAGLSLIRQDFHGSARGKAIAAWGATVAGTIRRSAHSSAARSRAGCLSRDLHRQRADRYGAIWRSSTKMRNHKDPGETHLDGLGLITFSAAMFLLELGLIRGNSLGWSSGGIIAMLAGSALGFVGFVLIELRQARPMFDLSLFRKPGFSGVSVGTFAVGGGMFALLPHPTLYLQNDLGYSPPQGGLRLLPLTVLTFLVPLVFHGPAEKLPPGIVIGAGFVVAAGGIAALLAISPGSGWTDRRVAVADAREHHPGRRYARVGLGVVPPERSGMASGISHTFRIGGLGRVVSSAGIKTAAQGQSKIADAARFAFVSGLRTILVIGASAVAIGAALAVGLARSRDVHRPPVPLADPANEPLVTTEML